MISLQKFSTASFDVDAEKCFTPLCPDELPIPEGDQIVEELNAQARYARLRIGSKDAHNPKSLWVTKDPGKIATPITTVGNPDIDLYWTLHGVPGTMGFELLDGLPKPVEYDYFVWKGIELNMHPYGACYHDLSDKLSTGVIEYLRAHEIIMVIIGGLALDYCAGITGLQLLKAGFKVIVNLKATRGLNPTSVDAMMAKLQAHGAVFINGVQEIELL